jgi:hypothetical protein
MTLRRLILTTTGLLLACPIANAAAISVTYHGGPVMHASRIVVVNYDSTVPAAFQAADPGFFTTMSSHSGDVSPVWAVTAEYPDTTGASPYDMTYVGQYTISPSAGNDGATIDAVNDVQPELIAQIDGGHLPAPTGDGMTTIYVVNYPASKSASLGGNTNNFCGYHYDVVHNSQRIIWVGLPDVSHAPFAGGCGAQASATDNHDATMSHEVVEAVNDPLIAENNVAWYDNSNGEIGDICSSTDGTNYGYIVQQEWSNSANACITGETGHFSKPSVSFTSTPAPTSGQAVTFGATGSSTNSAGAIAAGIASFAWDFGDGQAGSGASPSHTYGTAGPITLGVTARDTLGFTAFASTPLSVGDAPPAPPAPPVPPATPSATNLASLSVSGKAKLKSSKGKLLLDTGRVATCPVGPSTCLLHVTVRPKLAGKAARLALARALAKATIPIAPGHSKRITIKLSTAAVRKAARKHKVKLTVGIVVERGAKTGAPKSFTLTLNVPKR